MTRRKKFKNGNDVINIYIEYLDDIYKNGYYEVPSKTAFSFWLSKNKFDCDRRTIWNSLNLYFPEIKSTFIEIQGEFILTGAMMGHYKEASTIFALKNWNGYTDRRKEEIETFAKVDELLNAMRNQANAKD